MDVSISPTLSLVTLIKTNRKTKRILSHFEIINPTFFRTHFNQNILIKSYLCHKKTFTIINLVLD